MAFSENNGSYDRRRHPRYYVTSRVTLAIEDESLKESLGIGEPQDISLGGVRVTNLPSCPNVKVGDQLGLLLLDGDDALSLTGEVVHHSLRHSCPLDPCQDYGNYPAAGPVDILRVPGVAAG